MSASASTADDTFSAESVDLRSIIARATLSSFGKSSRMSSGKLSGTSSGTSASYTGTTAKKSKSSLITVTKGIIFVSFALGRHDKVPQPLTSLPRPTEMFSGRIEPMNCSKIVVPRRLARTNLLYVLPPPSLSQQPFLRNQTKPRTPQSITPLYNQLPRQIVVPDPPYIVHLVGPGPRKKKALAS
mmetsp:Transcript_39173/g.91257  ORF Transcript_39173/g.91257 Transcript_39173/m.91257 type:complete len:185 (-) Transcript_39173:791-1345(-)